MALFGKTGFIRQQEKAFARKLLVWKYEKSQTPLPDEEALSAHAQRVVDEAHVIARRSGGNLMQILKDLIQDVRNK